MALKLLNARDSTSFTLTPVPDDFATWPESRVPWATSYGRFVELAPGFYRVESPGIMRESSTINVTTMSVKAGVHKCGHATGARRLQIKVDAEAEVFITRMT